MDILRWYNTTKLSFPTPTPQMDTPNFRSVNLTPPQNIEVEEAVLGGILLDPEGISRVSDKLIPEAFYTPVHTDIYKAA